jgi:hypothetical protein
MAFPEIFEHLSNILLFASFQESGELCVYIEISGSPEVEVERVKESIVNKNLT